MLLTPSDVMLRRDELAQLLKLDPLVVDALLHTGTIDLVEREGSEFASGAQLEQLFRDSLMNLYYAQATRQASTSPAPVPEVQARRPEPSPAPVGETIFELEEELPPITRTSDEHIAIPAPVEDDRVDLRMAPRYVPRRQLGGSFRDVKVVVLQLSNTGFRIRHADGLRPGEEARFSFAIQTPPRSFVVRARVAWTSIAQRGSGPSFYISGLRVTSNQEALANAIDLLRNGRELQLADEKPRRATAGSVPRPVTGLPDEDVVAIIRAVRVFASDPAEASRWYTRARFAVADENIRKAAPRGARDREEVLGIWEYLQRRIDIAAVAGVVQWIRNSQVASV